MPWIFSGVNNWDKKWRLPWMCYATLWKDYGFGLPVSLHLLIKFKVILGSCSLFCVEWIKQHSEDTAKMLETHGYCVQVIKCLCGSLAGHAWYIHPSIFYNRLSCSGSLRAEAFPFILLIYHSSKNCSIFAIIIVNINLLTTNLIHVQLIYCCSKSINPHRPFSQWTFWLVMTGKAKVLLDLFHFKQL